MNERGLQSRLITVRKGSFIRVVFPFSYGSLTDAAFRDASAAFAADGWTAGRDLRPFLLPHVARHFAAEAMVSAEAGDAVEADDHSTRVARMLRLTEKQLQTRLKTKSFKLDTGTTQPELRFTGAELAIFRFGIAFLSLDVVPTSDDVADWQDVAHFLRFYDEPGRRAGHRECALLAPEADTTTRRVIDTMLSAINSRYSVNSLWLPAQMFGYASIVLDGPEDADADLFRAYYRFRRFFHSGQALLVTEEHAQDLSPSPVMYGDRAYLLHSLDGGGFAAVNPPQTEFFTHGIHDHMRGAYFTGFLVAMHLRLLLTSMSDDLVHRWSSEPDDEMRLEIFTTMKAQLIDVVARCSFVQVMQTQNHHAGYRRWLEVLEIELFQKELSIEISDMHDYLYFVTGQRAEIRRKASDERAQKAERTFTVAGLAFAVTSLLLAALGVNVTGWTTASDGVQPWILILLTIVSLLVGLAIGLAVVRKTPRRAGGRS